nr:NF038122 family metalloprotease [Calothrix sp. MO_192.B10]
MAIFNYQYSLDMSIEEMLSFELAGLIWGQYITDDIQININVDLSNSLGENVIGGALPVMHEQNYGIYQEYLQRDITSSDDEQVYYYLQDGNTVDFLYNGQVIDGNSQILLTSAQMKALGMDEALDLDLDEILDLLNLQQLIDKLVQKLGDEGHSAYNTANNLKTSIDTTLDPKLWQKILNHDGYAQLDQYLQGNLVLDASVITYFDATTAQTVAQDLDTSLQAARDLAAQLVLELDSYETRYINQQLQQNQEQLIPVFVQDKGTWTRDLVDPNATDGTIVLNSNFTWDSDYSRTGEAGAQTVDILSVALHETGHIMGFVSGLDYTLEQNTLYSGQEQLSNFTPFDLFRFSEDSGIADLSGNLFSIDGGATIIATLSQGTDSDYQASHWKRRYNALGVMDPTLWYGERAEVSELDVQAMDGLGYDVNPDAGWAEDGSWTVDLPSLLEDAKLQLADKLGVTVTWIEENLSAEFI